MSDYEQGPTEQERVPVDEQNDVEAQRRQINMPNFLRRPLLALGAVGALGGGVATASLVSGPERANADGIVNVAYTIGGLNDTQDGITLTNHEATECITADFTTYDSTDFPDGFYTYHNLDAGSTGVLPVAKAAEGKNARVRYYDCADTTLAHPLDTHNFVFTVGYEYPPITTTTTTTTQTTTTETVPTTTATQTIPTTTETVPTTTATQTIPTPVATCTVPKIASKKETLAQAKAQIMKDVDCLPGTAKGEKGYPKLTKKEKAKHLAWRLAGFAVKNSVATKAVLPPKAKAIKVGAYTVLPGNSSVPASTTLFPFSRLSK